MQHSEVLWYLSIRFASTWLVPVALIVSDEHILSHANLYSVCEQKAAGRLDGHASTFMKPTILN